MDKEKLYIGVDYPKAYNEYEFHMKDGSVFIAFCKQDGGIKWKLKRYANRPMYCSPISINIKDEDVDYFLDLGTMALWF